MFQLINCQRFDPNQDGSMFEWDVDEPNNSGNEDCVEVRSNTKMNDEDCETYKHGLCEIKVFDC